MDKEEARRVIGESAIVDYSSGSPTARLVEITTAPTDEQYRALKALQGDESEAHADVRDALDLDAGATWNDVVQAILADVTGVQGG